MSTFVALLSGRPEAVALLGLGLGVLVIFFGAVGAFAGPSAEVRRIRGGTAARGGSDLLSRGDTDPRGIFKVFMPASRAERSKIGRKMRQAGIYRPGAVRNFYIVRGALGVGLPSLAVALLFLPAESPLPSAISAARADLDWSGTFQLLTALLVVGFYGPS